MSLTDWMPILVTKLGEITELTGGVRAVYQSANDDAGIPGSLQEFPIAIVETPETRIVATAGNSVEYTDVNITIYIAGQFIPEALNEAITFRDLVRDKLAANGTLDSTVSWIYERDPWVVGPGSVNYGDKTHMGIVLQYFVKENVTDEVTVTA